jgi:uncharacterized protein
MGLQNPLVVYILLFFAGLFAYIISTLSGGGGSLLLIPVINFLIGTRATAPLINLGNLIGEPVRLILFWKYIRWNIIKFYLPSAIAGTILGAWLFTNINLEWLQIIIGIFLISTIFQYRFGKKKTSFNMKIFWFIPTGFLVEFFSSLVGATGPVLNPFYLNYGLDKEQLIATKTFNSFVIGMVQIISYSTFGSLHGNLWFMGIVLGTGAAAGNWIGKKFLSKISNETFRKSVIAIMVLSGIIMIIKYLIKK